MQAADRKTQLQTDLCGNPTEEKKVSEDADNRIESEEEKLARGKQGPERKGSLGFRIKEYNASPKLAITSMESA